MPRPKKPNPDQISLLELTLKTAPCVRAIRQAVREWVAGGYKGATTTTKTLLNYWFHTDHRTAGGDKFQYHYFIKRGKWLMKLTPAPARSTPSSAS